MHKKILLLLCLSVSASHSMSSVQPGMLRVLLANAWSGVLLFLGPQVEDARYSYGAFHDALGNRRNPDRQDHKTILHVAATQLAIAPAA